MAADPKEVEAVIGAFFADDDEVPALSGYVTIFDRNDPWWIAWAERVISALDAVRGRAGR